MATWARNLTRALSSLLVRAEPRLRKQITEWLKSESNWGSTGLCSTLEVPLHCLILRSVSLSNERNEIMIMWKDDQKPFWMRIRWDCCKVTKYWPPSPPPQPRFNKFQRKLECLLKCLLCCCCTCLPMDGNEIIRSKTLCTWCASVFSLPLVCRHRFIASLGVKNGINEKHLPECRSESQQLWWMRWKRHRHPEQLIGD